MTTRQERLAQAAYEGFFKDSSSNWQQLGATTSGQREVATDVQRRSSRRPRSLTTPRRR